MSHNKRNIIMNFMFLKINDIQANWASVEPGSYWTTVFKNVNENGESCTIEMNKSFKQSESEKSLRDATLAWKDGLEGKRFDNKN